MRDNKPDRNIRILCISVYHLFIRKIVQFALNYNKNSVMNNYTIYNCFKPYIQFGNIYLIENNIKTKTKNYWMQTIFDLDLKYNPKCKSHTWQGNSIKLNIESFTIYYFFFLSFDCKYNCFQCFMEIEIHFQATVNK